MDKDTRTLCAACAAIYRGAGFALIPLHNANKEPCDICKRAGFEYVVVKGLTIGVKTKP